MIDLREYFMVCYLKGIYPYHFRGKSWHLEFISLYTELG